MADIETIHGYHAHIYCRDDRERAKAAALRKILNANLKLHTILTERQILHSIDSTAPCPSALPLLLLELLIFNKFSFFLTATGNIQSI